MVQSVWSVQICFSSPLFLGINHRTVGDVIYLRIPKQEFVILGSALAVTDLLEKRSEIYSDRPYNVMNEL